MGDFIRGNGVSGLIQLGLIPICLLLFSTVFFLCRRLGKKDSLVILLIGIVLPWIPASLSYYIGYQLLQKQLTELTDPNMRTEFKDQALAWLNQSLWIPLGITAVGVAFVLMVILKTRGRSTPKAKP